MGQIEILEVGYGSSTPEKLFSIFLFIAVCVILVRMMKLAWRLWPFRSKQQFIHDETRTAEQIAKSVLKGLYKREPKASHNESIFKVDSIETRFLYLWETCRAMIQSTKTLALLTIILSFCVAVLGCINICSALMTEETAGIAAAAGGWREVFLYLAMGLFVSAFFYAVSIVFGGVLSRRRRNWNYLRARIREDISSNKNSMA